VTPSSSRWVGARDFLAGWDAPCKRRPRRAGRPATADRKIKARLFYVAEDGRTLTSVG
jgi:hypothetical protein